MRDTIAVQVSEKQTSTYDNGRFADDRKDFWREALMLRRELGYRLLCCIYAALSTAYFAVIVPYVLRRSRIGGDREPEYLSEKSWFAFIFVFTVTTSFFVHALYRFPPPLLDRLYTCACHLGEWRTPAAVEVSPTLFDSSSHDLHLLPTWPETSGQSSHAHGAIVLRVAAADVERPLIANLRVLAIASRHPHYDRVTASPNNELHALIYASCSFCTNLSFSYLQKLGKNPTSWLRYACMAQGALIVCQFHALVMLVKRWISNAMRVKL